MRTTVLAVLASAIVALAQPASLHWRMIGPFRGGRVTSVAGVSGQPNVYYFGTPGGGIWKSTNGGQVWKPIFDSTGVPSIGALAVAPSAPNTIYAGTGERWPGKGVYKSTDAGATWTPAGLPDAQYIQALIVDPRNPDHVIAGVNSVGYHILWRPLPNTAYTAARGIFETRDGGRTWRQTLVKQESLGVVDLTADPANPRNLYAVLYYPPSGKGKSLVEGTSDLYRSTDGGATWKPLSSEGLPSKDRGRVGISIGANGKSPRLYAVLEQGFFRSDDGGAHWTQASHDPRVVSSNYFSRVFTDPNRADTVYVTQTSMYRSTDGGHTFEAFVGAPSGDDFHVLWIDPANSKRMLLGVDQGAIVTVDGGETWSDWNNQPTGEFYHVATDQQFPYRVYAAQQDSGTAAVLSRSDNGQIRLQDWSPIGGFEYTHIAPDPAHSNLVYSQGWYGSMVRYDSITGMISAVFEAGDDYRHYEMPPLAFSPQNPAILYYGMQYLLRTSDGGVRWDRVSPDLTGYQEPPPGTESDPDKAKPPAISALALSKRKEGLIWAGTSNRRIQLSSDAGAHWQDVTPPGTSEPMSILILEAGHHDDSTAYVAAGSTRYPCGPYLARTHDGGKTWTTITNGLPAADSTLVVREDPARARVLYAGTTTGAYVSYDDGDHWQSLQLNLPHTAVTDLDVHGDDLVASTYGRGLWILDGLGPVREPVTTTTRLYRPSPAMRARWDNYPDTPLQIETPAGDNPPDGAILDYSLDKPAAKVTITIKDSAGAVVRRFSSDDKSPELPLPNVPQYWFGPEARPTVAAGHNRFIWDLRVATPPTIPYSYTGNLLTYTEYSLPDHAIKGNTPREQPVGPLVLPGIYSVELEVAGGTTQRQQLEVRQDPRVPITDADLREQWTWEQQAIEGMQQSSQAFLQMTAFRKQLPEKDPRLEELDKLIKGSGKTPGAGTINRDLSRILTSLQSGDVRPSNTITGAIDRKLKALAEILAKWRTFNAAPK